MNQKVWVWNDKILFGLLEAKVLTCCSKCDVRVDTVTRAFQQIAKKSYHLIYLASCLRPNNIDMNVFRFCPVVLDVGDGIFGIEL